MRIRQTFIVFLVVPAFLVGIFLVGDQIAKQNIRHADFGPLTNLLMGGLGEMLTVPIPDSGQADARLFTTYQKATEVVRAIDSSTRKILPKPSSELSTISINDRLDGWGNPFCVVEIRGRIAALSGGPGQHGKLNCADLRLDYARVGDEPSGRLYRYPSGELVFISVKPL